MNLRDGRLIQLVVLKRSEQCIADVNVTAQTLADKCRIDGTSSNLWVRSSSISPLNNNRLTTGLISIIELFDIESRQN